MQRSEVQSATGDTPRRDVRVPGRIGRFRLIELLGRGSMALVYRAEDMALRRHVALKLLPQRFKVGERTVLLDQFIHEARSAARLDHPNIVRVYEVGRDHGWFYIAMELLEGCNLYELVDSAGKLDAIRACQLAADAADALAYAHDHNVIHRDVKPGNLMFTRTGRCRVTDFGLARIIDTEDGYVLPTETVGTPYYIAPEVVRGSTADARSDIYSLGATVWHLITGVPPFLADHPRALMMKHVTAPLPDLHETVPDAPNDLKRALEKALAKNPDDRFAHVRQFAQVLRQLTVPGWDQLEPLTALSLASEQLARKQPTALDASRRKWRRTLLTLGITSAVLSAAAMAVSFTYWFEDEPTSLPPMQVMREPKPEPVQAVVVKPSEPVTAVPAPALEPTPEPEPVAESTLTASIAQRMGGVSFTPPEESKPDIIEEPGVLRAGDPTAFRRIIDSGDRTEHTIGGRVTDAHVTSTGKSFRIRLDGRHGPGDFYAVAFPGQFDELQARFGGSSGSGLLGKRVRIRGVVGEYAGAPQIILNGPSQIQVVEESPR